MSDDMLSQDEIDALLNSEDESAQEQSGDNTNSNNDQISSLEEDALGEIGNISFGSSATALSSILNQKVEITTPEISVVTRTELPNEFPKPHVAVHVKYTEGFTGENVLVIKSNDASTIADIMLEGDGTSPEDELKEVHLSAIQEAMNQMMGSAATSMSTIFNKKVDISPPAINMINLEEDEGLEQIPNDEILVKISFQLKIGNIIDSNIMQLLPIKFAKELVEELMNPPKEEAEESSDEHLASQDTGQQTEQRSSEPIATPGVAPETNDQQPKSESVSGSNSFREQPPQSPQFVGGSEGQKMGNSDIQTAEFQNFDSIQLSSNEQRNLDMLMDIPLKVTVELGRTKRTIKEILELSSGSVVELDKLAGEPVDIHVNDRIMAKGEVVVIDENFGVRVTDILSRQDRLSKLR